LDSDKKPKVCIVAPFYYPSRGGVGRQAVALTEKLKSFGVDLFVITRKMKGLPEYDFNPHIPICRARSLRPHIHNLPGINFLNLMISLSFCLSTAFILFKKRNLYDIVHFHGAGLPLIVNVLPLKFYRKKVIALVAGAKQGMEAGSFHNKYHILGRLLIRILKWVDCFVAISDEIYEDLGKDGYDPNKIIKISNFIDQNVFFPIDSRQKGVIRGKHGFNDRKIIAFSGRLVKGKGLQILLESMAKLIKGFENILLIILGDGPLGIDLKKKSQTMGIEKNIKFFGFVDNIHEYLAVADVFAFPSFQEGLPNAVLEAMACGLPVVSTKIGGVVDVIEDGENGLLVEPGNADQLSDAIKRLIIDTEYASKLGRNALKTIRENYDINGIATKYIDLYSRLFKSLK